MNASEALLLDPAPFEIWVADRGGAAFGSGTMNDPYDGSTAVRFDAVMNKFASLDPSNSVTIRLGPGIFKTAGFCDDLSGGWEAKPNMRILGASMALTTLQLEYPVVSSGKQYFAVGHKLCKTINSKLVANAVDYFELSDLTISVNLPAQAISAGALRLMGNHVRINRVKAIGWGNRTSTNTCFVFGLITGDPSTSTDTSDSGFFDCVADTPHVNNSGTYGDVLIFHNGGKDYAAQDGGEVFGTAPYIRNCRVDCGELPGGEDYRTKFYALSMGNCIGGSVYGNQVFNTVNGGPYLKKWSVRSIIVRDNYYHNVFQGIIGDLGTFGTSMHANLSRYDSDSWLAVAATVASSGSSTPKDHNLNDQDIIRVSSGPGAASFYGFFVSEIVRDSQRVSYQMTIPPPYYPVSTTGVINKMLTCQKIVIEGNFIRQASSSTSYRAIKLSNASTGQTTTHPYREVLLKNNKIMPLDSKTAGTGWIAIDIDYAANLIIRDNILSAGATAPIRGSNCPYFYCLNNRSTAAELLRGYDVTSTPFFAGELEEDAELGCMMGLVRL